VKERKKRKKEKYSIELIRDIFKMKRDIRKRKPEKRKAVRER
jgi:hypothetical protein